MGWVDPPKECPHKDRPMPLVRDENRIWECDDCGEQFQVEVTDYGHDVMPGERRVDAHWKELRFSE